MLLGKDKLDQCSKPTFGPSIGSSACSSGADLHSRYCGGIFGTDVAATSDYITICGRFCRARIP